MVGRFKKQAINKKKNNLASAVKKQKKLKKAFNAEKIQIEMEVDGTSQAFEANDIEMNDSTRATPKVREDKLRRTNLPLKTTIRGAKNQKNSNVVSSQPLSKKKANKLLKAQRRVQREKERRANAME